MVSEASTSSVIVLPVRVLTKICILVFFLKNQKSLFFFVSGEKWSRPCTTSCFYLSLCLRAGTNHQRRRAGLDQSASRKIQNAQSWLVSARIEPKWGRRLWFEIFLCLFRIFTIDTGWVTVTFLPESVRLFQFPVIPRQRQEFWCSWTKTCQHTQRSKWRWDGKSWDMKGEKSKTLC